jgi:hypothetical protein
MMRSTQKTGWIFGGALTIAFALVSSCSGIASNLTNPGTQQGNGAGSGNQGSSPVKLLACPTNQAQMTSSSIGLAGGVLSLAGTSVTIPLGALSAVTTVELSIPAGPYMEADLTVNGGQHITFLQPVVVTVDYSRCNRNDTQFRTLTVWNIDPATKALLEDMGGVDNKVTQSITFLTPHFSGFAVAY